MDLSQLYMLEMMRKRRLRNTIREDIAWDILIPDGGATYSMQIQRGSSAPAIIAWGDGDASEIITGGYSQQPIITPLGVLTPLC